MATTLPCPLINVLTGFTQPLICINQNPVATFEVVILNPNPNVNGILKGTQWNLDWGDGTTVTYTSTADNDLPPVALRTHTYSTVTTCNYVFSNSIQEPLRADAGGSVYSRGARKGYPFRRGWCAQNCR
ncbi:MAG: hypothetical protein IPJ37_05800 [Bacteroidales bacterium]|nr:hypothetical protein [Bacteroidales bacterium]